MPRPKTKTELLVLSQTNYSRLIKYVDAFNETERNQEFPEKYLNRNCTDVLAHLHHWHLLVLEWYSLGMTGEQPEMPAKGHTWKTVPELNRSIWEIYNDADHKEVKRLLESSFENVQKLVNKHTDQELFQKKKYNWTGSTSLGAYLISATSSHYDWAYRLIKKCMKR